MSERDKQYLQGLITAKVAVCEIEGTLPVVGMSDQTWKLICAINARLNELIGAEIKRTEPSHD